MSGKITTVKVSNDTVKPVKESTDMTHIKGYDWFSQLYCLIFHLGKKFSGKTTTIENELKKITGQNTTLIFIVPTIYKDQSWLRIVKYWEGKGNDVVIYDDLYDEEGNNVLDEFMALQNEEAKRKQDGGKQQIAAQIQHAKRNRPKMRLMSGGGKTNQQEFDEKIAKLSAELNKSEPKQKIKVKYPEYIFVIDDLAEDMRNKSLTNFLKKHRHFKTKVLLSGQAITDLVPKAIQQLDYVLAFGNLPDEDIAKLRHDLGLNISLERLLELYHDATSKKFNFLYIGRTPDGEEYRKNFNEKYII